MIEIFFKELFIEIISDIYIIEKAIIKIINKIMDNFIYLIVAKLLELLNNLVLTSSILFFLTNPLSNPAAEVCEEFSSSKTSSFFCP